MKVKLKFKNVLFVSLSRLLFLVQAQGLCPQRELVYRFVAWPLPLCILSHAFSFRRMALPGGVAMVEFSIKAHKTGRFIFLASMNCDQLTDVRGWAEIEVVPSKVIPS